MELSQSDEDGLVARANAIIWSSKYRFIAPYFESVTSSPLQEGMDILVEVQVNYSQLYGCSLIINDIDPEYSLGIKEVERQKTIARLHEEGLMELQKGFSLPSLPYHLAVISASDAAGYRDFIRHIEENPCGFRFDVELYPALMQGADCPQSIIDALDRILESGKDHDVVLILRGGGSKLDLACFDDYELCSAVAQYPLPVMTAIGHDQDFHICDMVAHEYVKTPTALADYIIGIYEEEDEVLASFSNRIRLAFSNRLAAMEKSVDRLGDRVRNGFAMKISLLESSLELIRTRISSADPRRIMERGYALAVGSDGVVLKGAGNVVVGDKVQVMFEDGTLMASVDEVILKPVDKVEG